MAESGKSETSAKLGVTESENAESQRVPFSVEMMELDSNPIVLQSKSY